MVFPNSGIGFHRRNALQASRHPPFDASRHPPRFLSLQINKRCNLRCEHCTFWHLDDDDRSNYLDREARRRVLREFADMNPRGAVVICGGETMLDLEDFFDVSRTSRELGLTCLSVINGTRVRSAEMAERMITDGPHEISVSLNSQRADLHDQTRGVRGSFDKAVTALRLLLDARKRLGNTSAKLYAMGLIFDKNYLELPLFYDFVLNEIGADKLKLNFIQPSFGGTEVDTFFANNSDVDPDRLLEQIKLCGQRFGIDYSPAWIDAVGMYFRSLRGVTDLAQGWGSKSGTQTHICNTYERNIMVDHYGMAKLCFSTSFRSAPLRETGDLKRFWLKAEDIRSCMRSCNQFCGISHSVRRESTTLTPAAYSRYAESAMSEV